MWKMSLDPLMLHDELSRRNMRTNAFQMRPQSNTEQKHRILHTTYTATIITYNL